MVNARSFVRVPQGLRLSSDRSPDRNPGPLRRIGVSHFRTCTSIGGESVLPLLRARVVGLGRTKSPYEGGAFSLRLTHHPGQHAFRRCHV